MPKLSQTPKDTVLHDLENEWWDKSKSSLDTDNKLTCARWRVSYFFFCVRTGCEFLNAPDEQILS